MTHVYLDASALVNRFRHELGSEVVDDVIERVAPDNPRRLVVSSLVVESQPELLAQHYTEAGLTESALVYWQRAGQQALQHSANPEAVRHLTRGIELLSTLPDTPARAQQELELQLALGPALMATNGQAAPEVEQAYARARALCAQIGETPQLVPTLRGLCRFYPSRGPLATARE